MSELLDRPAGHGLALPHDVPVLATGIDLIGRYDGSGYREPKYLVGRADGQIVQVSELLFRLAEAVDGLRTTDELAAHVAAVLDRPTSAADVAGLVTRKLRPSGIVAPRDGAVAAAALKSDPLLGLRLRTAVLPDHVVSAVADRLRPLFAPVAVVVALVAFVTLDVVTVARGGAPQLVTAAVEVARQPGQALLVFAMIAASGVFHEFGHAAACRYGGARTGVMGVGVYLVWPAFYSTVTDSYRLSRAGRLRTDLGGVYFNAIYITGLTAVYLATGSGWLLVAAVVMHGETARQFLPSIRLDGYYILSDLIGLPDLFMFLRPVLRSVVPGRPVDPAVAELKPATRRLIVLWVLLVIPFLLSFVVTFLVLAPHVLPAVWAAVVGHVGDAATGIRTGAGEEVALALLRALLLVLPVLGVGVVLTSWGRRVARSVHVPTARRRGSAAVPIALVVVALPVFLSALVNIAGVDQRPAAGGESGLAAAAAGGVTLGWPGDLAAAQIAAGQALLRADGGVLDSARTVLVVVGLVTCLSLWPLARRIGLPGPAAATAVALAALPVSVAFLHGTVDPGGLAALWLVAAGGLAGRGRGAGTATAAFVGLAVFTAPVAAAGVLAFAAHGVLVRQFARRWAPWPARALGVALAAGAVVAAVHGSGPGAGPVAWPVALGALVVGGAVVVVSWLRLGPVRPVATGAAALLAVAAVPTTGSTTALLVAVPPLAVLAAALLQSTTSRSRPRQARVVLATAIALGIACSGPLAAQAAALDPQRGALAAWVGGQLDPAVVLHTDALTAAQLVRDGVSAARLVPDARPGEVVVGDPATTGPYPVLVTVPDGPAGRPVTVRGPAATDDPAERVRIGGLLATNPALDLSGPAAAALRNGAVDPRLTAVLSGLAAAHRLTVDALPVVPGEPDDGLRRVAVLSEIDGSPVDEPGSIDLVQRWLDGQQDPFRPAATELVDGAYLIRYTVPSP